MSINKDLISLHYINLKEREDRKNALEANLATNGFNSIDIERFEAYKDPFGELGCAKSHFMLLSNLLCKSNSSYHIILEDDFRFSVKLEQLLMLINIIEKTQLELDIFHLYTLRPIPEVVKKIQNKNSIANLCRITYGQSTAAYIIKKNGLIKLIAHDTTMKIPIFNTLYFNQCKKIISKELNIEILNNLKFNTPDIKRYPMIKLLKLLPIKNSLYETVIVSANDCLVELFLKEKIGFSNIQRELFKIIQSKEFIGYKKKIPNKLEDILNLNNYVRLKIMKKVYKFGDVKEPY